VLDFICFICVIAGGPGYYTGAGWATFVSIVGMIVTLSLLCLYLFHVVDVVPQVPWIIAVRFEHFVVYQSGYFVIRFQCNFCAISDLLYKKFTLMLFRKWCTVSRGGFSSSLPVACSQSPLLDLTAPLAGELLRSVEFIDLLGVRGWGGVGNPYPKKTESEIQIL
jgi:hypothetical protein